MKFNTKPVASYLWTVTNIETGRSISVVVADTVEENASPEARAIRLATSDATIDRGPIVHVRPKRSKEPLYVAVRGEAA